LSRRGHRFHSFTEAAITGLRSAAMLDTAQRPRRSTTPPNAVPTETRSAGSGASRQFGDALALLCFNSRIVDDSQLCGKESH
jgi:hypothetical protein